MKLDPPCDGVLDIVQDTLQLPDAFTVTLANGDGTFRSSPSYRYQFPSQYQSNISMASGDFNGDGKVDLIFELAGSNQLALFLGNGDGTFQAPKYITVALPSGQHFGGGNVLAADFTGDGKLDVVTEGNTDTTGGAVYLMQGDGSGNFGNPVSIYPVGEGFIVAGDFDGDGKTDIAFPDNYDCTGGGCGASTVHVLYNTTGEVARIPLIVRVDRIDVARHRSGVGGYGAESGGGLSEAGGEGSDQAGDRQAHSANLQHDGTFELRRAWMLRFGFEVAGRSPLFSPLLACVGSKQNSRAPAWRSGCNMGPLPLTPSNVFLRKATELRRHVPV